jgi:hypothetical protein
VDAAETQRFQLLCIQTSMRHQSITMDINKSEASNICCENIVMSGYSMLSLSAILTPRHWSSEWPTKEGFKMPGYSF